MARIEMYPSGTTAGTVEEVGAALENGDIPIRSDGTPYTVTPFKDGLLLDGYPINVILLGVWYPGQQEALVNAGWTIPAAVLSLPVVAMPEPGGSMTKYLLYGAAGLLLYRLVK